MPHARQATTRPRVVSAVAFAFLLPSLAFGVVYGGMAGLVLGPLLGLLLGWPFVGVACGMWAILHHARRHHPANAAVVGVAAGLVVSSLLAGGEHEMPPLFGCAMLGLATGLGVWWIAYGRPDRLPKPIATRPPLSL